jgi:hypothetical protein
MTENSLTKKKEPTIIDKEVRKRLIDENLKLKDLAQKLHDAYQHPVSSSNLANKLSRDTLKYIEAVQIADVLGYDIVWQKRK